jgi:hypothetical protein
MNSNRKNVKTFFFIMAFFASMFSCKTDNSFDYPLVFTGAVINISETAATFTGKIANLGKYQILESGFIWSLYHSDANGIKIKNEETSTGIFSLNTNQELFPGKTYYVRAYVQTENSISFGTEVSFKSLEKEVNPGKWTRIFESQIATDWTDGCDYIIANFTINDSTYTILKNGKLYCYSHLVKTLRYLSETDFYYHYIHFSVVYNGYAYLFESDGFYRFDPKAFSFTKLKDPRLNQRMGKYSGFLNNDNIYVGIGAGNEYLKYNIAEDSWQQVQSFPGGSGISTYSFSIGDIGYIGNLFNIHAWNYDTKKDNWTQKANTPFYYGEIFYIDCTSTMSYGYCFYNNDYCLYKYYPVFDHWEKLAKIENAEGYNMCGPKLFVVGEKIYLVNIWNSNYTDHYNMWAYEK